MTDTPASAERQRPANWREVIDAADLPAAQRDLVRATVSRTRLWKREKWTVAEELIAHFHDANEARAAALGDPPPPAEATFGDPALTARLIRRAKQRNRSLIWHTWKWSRRALGVFLLLYALLTIRFFWGKPEVKVDYLARLNAPILAVPEEHRAWPLYREAMLGLGLKQGQDPIPLTTFLPGEETSVRQPGQDHWPELAHALRDHADEIALLREAAARPAMGLPLSFGVRPEDVELFAEAPLQPGETPHHPRSQMQTLLEVLLPQLGAMRFAAQVLAADAFRSAEVAEAELALGNIEAILGMADHAVEQPYMINGLVGLSINEAAFRVAGQLLAAYPELWDAGHLTRLSHRVATSEAARLMGFEGERALFYDLIQKIYTDDGHGDGQLTDEGLRMLEFLFSTQGIGIQNESALSVLSNHVVLGLVGPATMAAAASRHDLVSLYDELMDSTEKQLTAPLWEVQTTRVHMEIDRLNQHPLQRLRYSLVTALLPGIDAGRRTVLINNGHRDGLLVAISLELYRREHGGYPDPAAGLEVLVPRYLPEVPLGIGSGQPLRWTLRDGAVVVYDVGGDGDDDGGRAVDEYGQRLRNGTLQQGHEAVDGDWVAYPIQER